jgi:multidrug transporter EmrE-like cation transporter
MFDLISLGYGGAMALVDSLILSTLKAYSLGFIKWAGIIPLAMFFYSFQPLIFYKSLSHNSLTVMNLLWDVMSDVSVTIIGLFYFKEKLNKFKRLGVFFSLISIILLTYQDGDE